MKNFHLSLAILFLMILNNVQAQNFQWLSRVGGPSYDPSPHIPDELINDIATDEQGNVYACGRIRDNSNINGQAISTYGGNDIFLCKFDCFGNLVWYRVAGNSDDGDNGISLALDGLGHIYLTGEVYGNSGPTGQINFFDTVYHVNTRSMFLAKLDTSGNFIWGKIATSGSFGEKIVIDSEGKINVLVYNYVPGALFPGINVIAAFYVVRFDPSGNVEKALKITDGYSGGFRDMKMSADREFYFVGDYPLDSNIIGGVIMRKISPQNSYDFFCIKLDTSGIAQWYIHYGLNVSSFSHGYGCAFDANGDLFITGGAYNGLVLGPDTMRNSLAPTSPNDFPFVAKVNPLGQILWARNLHANDIARATGGLAVKSNGNALISGFFIDRVIMGPDSFVGSGSHNLFISEFSNNGAILYGTPVPTINGGTNSEPRRTIRDAADNIIFAGAYDGNLIVNGNTVPYAGGYTDGFIIKWGSALCTVGIEDGLSFNKESVLVYPNPATDRVRFKFPENLSTASMLCIFDLMGREVRKVFIPAHTTEQSLELNGLPSGLYHYAIQNSVERYSGKFMVAGE